MALTRYGLHALIVAPPGGFVVVCTCCKLGSGWAEGCCRPLTPRAALAPTPAPRAGLAPPSQPPSIGKWPGA